jgi:hypothetical protein
MSPETIKIIITAVLLLHGVAHGRAFFCLAATAAGGGDKKWIPLRSWLFPKASKKTVAAIAAVFWLLATLGFIVAALGFWGFLFPGAYWRQLALIAAVISTLGTLIFSGIWPGAPDQRLSTLDTVISLLVNVAVIFLLLVMQYPPLSMFGK